MFYVFDRWVSPQLRLNPSHSQLIFMTQEMITQDYFYPYSLNIVNLQLGKGFSAPIQLKSCSRQTTPPLLYKYSEVCPIHLLPKPNRIFKIENLRRWPGFLLEISWMRFKLDSRSCRTLHNATLGDNFHRPMKMDAYTLPSKHHIVFFIELEESHREKPKPRRIFYTAYQDRLHRLPVDGLPDQTLDVVAWRYLEYLSPTIIPNNWLGAARGKPTFARSAICDQSWTPNCLMAWDSRRAVSASRSDARFAS